MNLFVVPLVAVLADLHHGLLPVVEELVVDHLLGHGVAPGARIALLGLDQLLPGWKPWQVKIIRELHKYLATAESGDAAC